MYRRIGFTIVIISCLSIGFSSCSEKSYGCYDISENYFNKIEMSAMASDELCSNNIAEESAE